MGKNTLPNPWRTVRLDECIREKPSYGANAPAVEFDPSLPRYIRITDITSTSNLSSQDPKSITWDAAEGAMLNDGDFLFARTGATVGKAFLFKGDQPSAYAGYLIRFRLNEFLLLPQYLKHVTQSPMYWDWVKKMFRAGAQPNINATEYGSFELPCPPVLEQYRLSGILDQWDISIEKTERLFALRIRQKAWLLTRVISASGRITKLEAFLKQVSRPVPKPTEPYWALGIRSHGKGTFQRFVKNPGSVDMEELYALNRDDLIVNITFAWEGAIATVKPEDEGCLVSHRFPTYAVNQEIADPSFVKYIINRKAFFLQLALISPGGAGRNRVLNKKGFLKLVVSLPPLSEQKRLAQILGTMDLLIEKEKSMLISLKVQKRGLMQKLLTGQWRVKLLETDAIQ